MDKKFDKARSMRLFINFTVFSSTFVFNFCYIYNLYMIMPTQYKMDSYLLRDSLFVWWNSMYMNSFISSKNARKLVKITAKKTGICLYGEYNFSSWFSVSVRPNPPGIQSRGVFRISHRGGRDLGAPPRATMPFIFVYRTADMHLCTI